MSDTRHEDVRHPEDADKNQAVADEDTADPTTGEDAPQSDEDEGAATAGMAVVANPDLEAQHPKGSEVRHDAEHGWGAKEIDE
jgi:hypothetical protein